MIRQNIIIDGTTYIVDMYDAIEDLSKPPCTPYYAQFMMIRNGSLVNDIYSETDILLIEKSILAECTEDGMIDLSKLNDIIAFPITETQRVSFSRKYTDFNTDLNKYNFKQGSFIEKIYDLSAEAIAAYDEQYATRVAPPGESLSDFDTGYNEGLEDAMSGNPYQDLSEYSEAQANGYELGYSTALELGPKDPLGPEASIPCDRVLVYAPTIKSIVNAIFDIEVFINGTRFHLLCRRSGSLETNADSEFKVGNFTYSEFIEMYVPNVNILLSKDKYYFKDIFSLPGFRKKTVLSAIKVDENSIVLNEVKKKLHYINGNFLYAEDCNYVYTGDDTTEKIFRESLITGGAQQQTQQQQQAQSSNTSGASITIDMSPKPPKLLVPSTKYIINKKTVKTRSILLDESITIIQSFNVVNGGIDQEYTVLMSNSIMNNSYSVQLEGEAGVEDVQFDNSIVSTQHVAGSMMERIVVKDRDSGETVAIVPVDGKEVISINDSVMCSFHLFGMPFVIDQSSTLKTSTEGTSASGIFMTSLDNNGSIPVNVKTYYEDDANGTAISTAFQQKFIMYPTSSWNEQTSRYVPDEDMNLDIFSKNYHVTMQNYFDFFIYGEDGDMARTNGAIVIKAKFSYPSNFANVNKAYLNLMNESPYNYISEKDIDEFDEDMFPEDIDKCGFSIDIATDKKFKSIVYSDTVSIPIPNEAGIVIDDLTYSLSPGNLNVDWKSYPEILIARVKYYDKHTGTVIEGNHVVITKEQFKYMVNENAGRRVNINTLQSIQDMNFIDKISCTIVKNEAQQQNSTADIAKATPKVLYRPIFYKVKDLEQIKIKSGITQNIGLNLSSAMSKVDTFKMTIGDTEYVEIGRNDAYVIFKVNALELKDNAGQYNILNQDNEYISDGTWYIY